MKSIQEDIIVDLLLQQRKKIHFPRGVMGVDTPEDFFLIADAGDPPLFWIEEAGVSEVAFPVVDPFLILPEYAPKFFQNDLEELQLEQASDLFVVVIVSMTHQKEQRAAANLTAPLLINWSKSIGRQAFLANSKEYPSNFPLHELFEIHPMRSRH